MRTGVRISSRRATGRRWLRAAAVAVAVAAGLTLASTPASAHHWTQAGRDCYAPTPSDPGDSCDAYAKLTYGSANLRGWFNAYGEQVVVRNNTSKTAFWELDGPGFTTGGYVWAGQCIEWGRSVTNCRQVGGRNITEDKPVHLRICIEEPHRQCTYWRLGIA